MKYLTTLIVLLVLNTDSNFDYKKLIGTWSRKSIANTKDTGVFIFKSDSTASFEVRKANTDHLIAGMTGPYSILKSKGILKVTMLGKEKTFKIIKLSQDTLTFTNVTENKEAQTFVRSK
ncbi:MULTISPECIES: hypothetical protein [Chryseobacterium]|jgi:hypothetical protein|uniref:Lipocalin-like domain-containing protein n=2 Tax=Chryseobacterium aquaticum TaxID=452084 RepID=A0A101CGR4_9FLAO|nr:MULTISPECIES: hypothetical protein [Chryseobacterium]KNB60579.1 hypothetical protein AC804_15440 [Chryseobacterium sp. Hurlbut01]KUJ55938.1 hypothetical protein AR686_10020 [Chryseobacterium aquaticum subsp. greenlandense]NMR32605.1 hypothetical protein [Chryseobacterium aquaticum]NRQ45465.1 hypothetical protein [Chryseobacterium sp. C-204]